MGRKRKHFYVNRADKLASIGREGTRPEISEGLHSHTVNTRTGSFEKRFTHKLSVLTEDYLDAYVMLNDIVVLFPSEGFDKGTVDKLEWPEFDKSIGSMHGKRKKGAPKVKADSTICRVHKTNEEIVELKTPVGGQLIEINEGLSGNANLFENTSIFNGERYVAIIYPTTKIPGPQDTDIEKWKRRQFELSRKNEICFDFQNGTCRRGSTCRFIHVDKGSKEDDVDLINQA